MPAAWFQKIKLWLPPAFWALCILLVSSIPGDELPHQDLPYLDKMVHLGVYGVLGMLLARTRISFRLAWGLAALFGVIDELYQNLTPHRSPDPRDWVADVAGAVMGIVFAQWIMNRSSRQNP